MQTPAGLFNTKMSGKNKVDWVIFIMVIFVIAKLKVSIKIQNRSDRREFVLKKHKKSTFFVKSRAMARTRTTGLRRVRTPNYELGTFHIL